jgi:hypothetical protein
MALDRIRRAKTTLARSARDASVGLWETLEVRQLLCGSATVVSPAISLDPIIPAKHSLAASSVQGYTPAQIKAAYGFTGLSETGAGQTIAIIDAYNDPNIASDLGVFDSEFGLGAVPNFTVVSQTGSTAKLPQTNAGWAQETALDVEWAHAIAPQANILLVEASSDSTKNLVAAVNYARNASGVSVVSMSWGGSEMSNETSYDKDFTTPSGHTGVTFVAASGDEGADGGAEWPAVSPNVIAVGGTTLTLNGSTYSTESAWSDTSGGTSAYEPTPSYQASLGVSGRTTADVSYDADPNTGFPVYDSLSYQGEVGWAETGGTSAGTPQWAGIIALADQGRVSAGEGTLDSGTQTLPALYAIYANSKTYAADFNDITTGSNGDGSDGGSGGGFGGGGFSGGGFSGGGFSGGGYGGGGWGGGGWGGHHHGGFGYADRHGSGGTINFSSTSSSSGTVSLSSAATGYDSPTGLGTPIASGLVASLISYGSTTASVKAAKAAAHSTGISPSDVRKPQAVHPSAPPVQTLPPIVAAVQPTTGSTATAFNRSVPSIELDAVVASPASNGGSDNRTWPSVVESVMSGFAAEAQLQTLVGAVTRVLTPAGRTTAKLAGAAAAEARQAAVEIASSAEPYLVSPQMVLSMAHIDANATFCDALSSFTDELASIPHRVKTAHSSARPWVITGVVLGIDAILVARYRMKRALFNDRRKIAM